jgi:hypothetical protein
VLCLVSEWRLRSSLLALAELRAPEGEGSKTMRAIKASNEPFDSRSTDRRWSVAFGVAWLVAGAACGSSPLSVEHGAGGSAGVAGSVGAGGSVSAGGSAGSGGSTVFDSGADVVDSAIDVGSDAVAEADAAGTDGGDAEAGDGSDGADGSIDASGSGDGAVPAGFDLAASFVVDDTSYSTSTANSCWGNSGAITLADCASRAPGTPVGACHKISYTYVANTGNDCNSAPIVPPATSCTWVAQTWKSIPSKLIAPGATKVQFYAWGSGTVTAQVKTDLTNVRETAITLTTTPTVYSIDLTGLSYSAAPLETAFILVFVNTNSPAVVNIDGLQWL